MSSAVFQKTFSDLDLALFCFPKNQPVDPYNCALVSLQLMRLITPVKSNTLISKYPRGVKREEVLSFFRSTYGLELDFYNIPIEEFMSHYLDDFVFPGFACIIELISDGNHLSHSVLYVKTLKGLTFLVDAQTGKIYSRMIESPLIKPLDKFIQVHGINRINVLRHKEGVFPYDIHMKISNNTDTTLGKESIETFFKRGQIIESGTFPSSEIEMVAGKKSTKTRKTRGRLSRSANLSR